LKTFHTASRKDTNPCNQKLPGSENLHKIHNIKGSCSDCDGDHELEQGFCITKQDQREFKSGASRKRGESIKCEQLQEMH
jgi:hypothetical protein